LLERSSDKFSCGPIIFKIPSVGLNTLYIVHQHLVLLYLLAGVL
jgi:hypothetical protein